MNKPEFLICESRRCGNPIMPDNPIVNLSKKLRLDANSATHATLACSLACMLQILSEFVQEESKNEKFRADSLLAKNFSLEKINKDLNEEMEKNR